MITIRELWIVRNLQCYFAFLCLTLEKAGVEAIGDLYTLKDDDLIKVRNLGKKGINELRKFLDEVEGAVRQIPV